MLSGETTERGVATACTYLCSSKDRTGLTSLQPRLDTRPNAPAIDFFQASLKSSQHLHKSEQRYWCGV